MSPDTAIPFADSKYVNLRSFKRDGSPIDTPVWFALVGDRIVIFTDGTSYKVKRIRRNAKVELARCGVRGQLVGPWLPGRCRVVEGEPELITRAYDALNSKYLLMRVLTVIATIGGRVKRRLILEVTLDAAVPASQAS
ncbi:MAG TPA: PPOX class F420-dependent oxidoreductase [Polyangiales bacterium]|nr:PPOX class F420-dependent oxidoreductase [Polyangiales bacterium]